MKKVIVSVTNNLVTDQRVQRICQSLHDWGFGVTLVGRPWPAPVDLHRPYPCKRFRLLFNTNFLFYAEYNIRLFFFLISHKADILVSNDLDTLPANVLASKLKGTELYFDSHEYFSETPEVFSRKAVKSFWLFIERICIRKCDRHYTVSNSVAEIYHHQYGIKFAIIRNVPYRYKLPQSETFSGMILYQGTLNLSRGLELMIETMQLLQRYLLVIAGDGPLMNKLRELTRKLHLDEKIQFTGNLLPEKLRELTMKASVGISLEEPVGLSYISALPNKLFDYIQAGVPVLVSDLPEMKAIVENYNVGMILTERNNVKLADIIQQMMEDKEKRKTWKKNLFNAAEELCWEKESEKLKKIFF